jgi:hypothetical protein
MIQRHPSSLACRGWIAALHGYWPNATNEALPATGLQRIPKNDATAMTTTTKPTI